MRLSDLDEESPAAPLKLSDLPPDDSGGGFGHRAGVFATDFNAALGAPVDAATWLINKAYANVPKVTDLVPSFSYSDFSKRLDAAKTAKEQRADQPPLISNPVGGSRWFGDTFGRTEKKDALDDIIGAIGGGVGSAATGFGVGGALQAAGRAPTVARALMGGGTDPLSIASNVGAGVGSGAGSELGGWAGSFLSDNDPTWTALGRTIGGFGGAIPGALAPAAASAGAQAARSAVRPFSEQGRREIAGRALNESATNPWMARTALPDETPLGINPTLGQATNDPGLLQLERQVMQMSPPIAGQFAEQAGRNNQTIRGALDHLGQPGDRTPGEISAQAAPRLEATRAAAKDAERAAWEAVDPNNQVQIPMGPIRQGLQNFISNLTMARRRLVPDDLVTMFQRNAPGGGTNLPLREVQDLRSDLLGRERVARAGQDFNQANIYRNIDEAVFPGLDPNGGVGLPAGADPATLARHAAARAQTRQYHADYDVPPIRDLFRVNGTPDSAALDKMFAAGTGQAERVGQYIAATRGDPALMQHGRDWFTARMAERMSSATAQDNMGNQVVQGASLAKFVEQNRALINSPLFTPDQRRVINEMVDAVRMQGRTANAGRIHGGSTTAANLAGNSYVKALVGNWLGPLAEVGGAAMGAAAGAPFGHIGAAVGAGAGRQAGRAFNSVADNLYASAGERVKGMLAQAMTDPQFASELMRDASRANLGFASPRLQSLLTTVPMTIYGR